MDEIRPATPDRWNRREFLRRSAVGALALGGVSLLAACGGGGAAAPTAAEAAAGGAKATPTPLPSGVEVGVQTTGQAKEGQTKIEYYGGWTGPDGLTMKDMVNRHNETANDGIFTTLSIYDWDTLFAKMVAGFAAKTPPDMAVSHHKDIPHYV